MEVQENYNNQLMGKSVCVLRTHYYSNYYIRYNDYYITNVEGKEMPNIEYKKSEVVYQGEQYVGTYIIDSTIEKGGWEYPYHNKDKYWTNYPCYGNYIYNKIEQFPQMSV